jgi:hypothetical protein
MLERIKQKIQLLHDLDPKLQVFGSILHKHQIQPCLTEPQIQEYETTHGIQLPEDYRYFLLHVGNSGAGPGYGLKKLPNYANGFLKRSFAYTSLVNTDEIDIQSDTDDEYPYCGGIEILTYGCGYNAILVVTGEERGKIWFDNYGTLSPVPYSVTDSNHISFLPWYEQWLDVHIDALRNNKKIKLDWGYGLFS